VESQKIGFANWKDTLRALNRTTGQEKWSRGLSGGAGLLSAEVMVNDRIVYAGRGHLQALDAATGKELWNFNGADRAFARLISGGRIFVTLPTMGYPGSNQVDHGHLFDVDAKTGKLEP
jgi:outer membrane protein assembly factor BamB